MDMEFLEEFLEEFLASPYGKIVAATVTFLGAYGLYRIFKKCMNSYGEDEYFKSVQPARNKTSERKIILLIGLDGSGKTCFLKSFGEPDQLTIEPSPTTGLTSSRALTIGSVEFTLYEVGTASGLIKARQNWIEVINSLRTKTVAMVIDSADHNRIEEAKIALTQFSFGVRTEEMQLLIIANKQDIPGALTPSQVKERVVEDRYTYKRIDVVGTTVGPCKKRSGVYKAYEILSSFK